MLKSYVANIYDPGICPPDYFLRFYTPIYNEDEDQPDTEEDHELVTERRQRDLPPQKLHEALRAAFGYIRRHPRDGDVRWELMHRKGLEYTGGSWDWKSVPVFESRQEIAASGFRRLSVGDEELLSGTWRHVTVRHLSPGRTHIHVGTEGSTSNTDYTASCTASQAEVSVSSSSTLHLPIRQPAPQATTQTMITVARPLTPRQLDLLYHQLPDDQWCTPMMLGGTDGSHHSATLAQLVRKGLAERSHRGGHTRNVWQYRRTPAGRIAADNAQRLKGKTV